MDKLFEVSCAGLTLSVYEDSVSITPKGFLGIASKGLAGERKMFYKDISSVQFKQSTKLLSGFIEFYFAGNNSQKQGGGLFAGTTNDNRFTFYNKFLPDMIKINDYIQSKINAPIKTETTSQNVSAADEIKKFKQLLDDGIITQEDFDAKKKQLLGL